MGAAACADDPNATSALKQSVLSICWQHPLQTPCLPPPPHLYLKLLFLFSLWPDQAPPHTASCGSNASAWSPSVLGHRHKQTHTHTHATQQHHTCSQQAVQAPTQCQLKSCC